MTTSTMATTRRKEKVESILVGTVPKLKRRIASDFIVCTEPIFYFGIKATALVISAIIFQTQLQGVSRA